MIGAKALAVGPGKSLSVYIDQADLENGYTYTSYLFICRAHYSIPMDLRSERIENF